MLARLVAEHQARHTVAEAIEKFRAEYLPLLKPSTRVRYEVSFRQMTQDQKLYLDQISRAALADYASERLRAGVTPATIRRDLNTLGEVPTSVCAVPTKKRSPICHQGHAQSQAGERGPSSD